MHARCWPFTTDDKNLLKLASEMVLMLVFLSTAVLRSALAKLDLVDAGLLRADDLTSEEREMPGHLAVFMVVVTCSIPITILVYNHCVYKHRTSKSWGQAGIIVAEVLAASRSFSAVARSMTTPRSNV